MSQRERTSIETALIVNPNSGGGSTGKNWKNLYKEINKIFGENLHVAVSRRSGDGTALTRDLLKRGFRKIVVLGGDGTINEVANGFFEKIRDGTRVDGENNGEKRITETLPSLRPINPRAMMGLLPAGSRNVLAKSLDLPDGIVECCWRLVKAKPQKIDVITALVTAAQSASSLANENPRDIRTRIFLNAAELGVGAEIIEKSKKIRNKVKSRIVSTISSIIATMPVYESKLCDISIDNGRQTLLSNMTMGVIANGQYLGGGFKVAPHANISDGLLDITILKNSGSFKMLEGFANMTGESDHTKKKTDDIFYTQAKNVSIKSKEKDITVTLDGEPIGVLPALFEVSHNALLIKY